MNHDTTGEPQKKLVIGIGNPYQSDDGAGPEAARRVEAMHLPGVVVTTHSGEAASLMEAWKGFDHVIVVDAARSGVARPGTVHCFDAQAKPVPADWLGWSTHGFDLPAAVSLGRALNRLPARLFLYGIEGAHFEPGEELTPSVRQGAKDCAEQIALRLNPDASDATDCEGDAHNA